MVISTDCMSFSKLGVLLEYSMMIIVGVKFYSFDFVSFQFSEQVLVCRPTSLILSWPLSRGLNYESW